MSSVQSVSSQNRRVWEVMNGPLSADSKLADPSMTRRSVSDVSSCLSTSWASGCLGLHSQPTSRPARAVLNHPNATKRRMPQTQQTQTQPNANAGSCQTQNGAGEGPNAEWINAANADPDPNAGKRRAPKRRTQPNANAANAEWIQTQPNATQPNANAGSCVWQFLCLCFSVSTRPSPEPPFWSARISS